MLQWLTVTILLASTVIFGEPWLIREKFSVRKAALEKFPQVKLVGSFGHSSELISYLKEQGPSAVS